ncbi:phytoene desaturase family protein [Marinicrinis sediminis]|uniref:4,4'-diaponeurosporene oxygenase n=1 Tax=Marinicrinis sediminis TaxID=1652465 RepID=A0ABW5R8D5_9BACL
MNGAHQSSKSNRQIIVIGGGLGGLSASIRLAAAGYQVTVLEKEAQLGGKLQRVYEGAYVFDRGPSTITMLNAFQQVFEQAGRRIEDYVAFVPLSPLARNRFADGHQVDLVSDTDRMQEQIAAYSAEDAARYPAFQSKARDMLDISGKQFLHTLMLSWKDKLRPSLLRAFASIHPLKTYQSLLGEHFSHPNTLAMLGRYATYTGSSPFQTPAVFAMLPALETDGGIYGVKGGTYAIVQAFTRLAQELGVVIHTRTEAHQIRIQNQQATGVETSAGFFPADQIICNGDLLTSYARLLAPEHRPSMPDRKLKTYEPSLSGFVILAGLPRVYPQLLHHNVFFPADYPQEFVDLFETRTPVQDPAIYVCRNETFQDEPPDSPYGAQSRLFILVNAPALRSPSSIHWDSLRESYAGMILEKLAHYGLQGITDSEVRITYTPEQLAQDTYAHLGSIYGISSNGARQAFFRPANRSRDISNIWFAGGTTHPGGGTPIVTLSGQLVAERMIQLDKG